MKITKEVIVNVCDNCHAESAPLSKCALCTKEMCAKCERRFYLSADGNPLSASEAKTASEVLCSDCSQRVIEAVKAAGIGVG
jgi:hypothetical protein